MFEHANMALRYLRVTTAPDNEGVPKVQWIEDLFGEPLPVRNAGCRFDYQTEEVVVLIRVAALSIPGEA